MQRLAAALGLVTAVAVVVVSLSMGGPKVAAASTPTVAAQVRPSCSLSVDRMRIGSRVARKTVQMHLRCNYLVLGLGFRSSLPVRKVRRTAALVDGAPGDRLMCSRRWPTAVVGFKPRQAKGTTLGGCLGVTGYNTRSTITVALRKAVCRPRRLRVRVVAFGGLDCRGSLYPCAAIGYRATVARNVVGC